MKIKCCICEKLIDERRSNNPEGACWKDTNGNVVEGHFDPDDRCCNECDNNYVIPGRMYLMNKYRAGNN